jgi:hypothetical protein
MNSLPAEESRFYENTLAKNNQNKNVKIPKHTLLYYAYNIMTNKLKGAGNIEYGDIENGDIEKTGTSKKKVGN